MQVSYVVLYVDDAQLCRSFWIDKVGMVEKVVNQAGPFEVVRVGFANQPFSLELVPLELMADNPDGLDLATPSMCFSVDDLNETREAFLARGIEVTDVMSQGASSTFAFSDPEGRWFAVTA